MSELMNKLNGFDEHENFLGIGKKAKSKRAIKKASKMSVPVSEKNYMTNASSADMPLISNSLINTDGTIKNATVSIPYQQLQQAINANPLPSVDEITSYDKPEGTFNRGQVLDEVEVIGKRKKATPAKKDNTLLFIALGLAVVVVLYIVLRKK